MNRRPARRSMDLPGTKTLSFKPSIRWASAWRLCFVTLALAGSANAAPVSVSVPINPTGSPILQWISQSRTDAYSGSAVIPVPVIDYKTGTANIGLSVNVSAGGPIYAGPNVTPPTPSVSLSGSLSSPLLANGSMALNSSTMQVRTGGSPSSGFGWSATGATSAGYSATAPTGWGEAMYRMSSAASPTPTTLNLSTTVSGNAQFNQPFASASIRFDQASLFIEGFRRDRTGAADTIALMVGARDSAGNFVPIDDFAHAMGFDHFNFVNTILSSKIYDFEGLQWIDRPPANCMGVSSPIGPFGVSDPLPCGNFDPRRANQVHADFAPLYYDIVANAGGSRIAVENYDGVPYGALTRKPNGFTSFAPIVSDQPADIDAATGLMFMDTPDGVWAHFATMLVGVKGDSITPLMDRVFDWESCFGAIRPFTSNQGQPLPSVPCSPPYPGSITDWLPFFSVVQPLDDLTPEDGFDYAPISFAQFEERYGFSPQALIQSIQAGASTPGTVPGPSPLALMLAAVGAWWVTRGLSGPRRQTSSPIFGCASRRAF